MVLLWPQTKSDGLPYSHHFSTDLLIPTISPPPHLGNKLLIHRKILPNTEDITSYAVIFEL
ncbi:nod factor binding lectin-nucleotide phosphohydrolase [Sesbania bispinosa]|nr:nod factor binding lectin-nucleotide phosphohydrolase [Sesbania bispinosa]